MKQIFVISLLFVCMTGFAINVIRNDTLYVSITDSNVKEIQKSDSAITPIKKLIPVLLSFPVLGVVGLHRIYLGTKPYVPIVYIATLGGCLGIIPLIDFAVLTFSKKEKLQQYLNNPKVFMWIL